MQENRIWKGYDYTLRQVMRVVGRSIDKYGQVVPTLTNQLILRLHWGKTQKHNDAKYRCYHVDI